MHQSVLLNRAVDYLNLSKGAVVVDATVGGGGHSEEILKAILPGGRLIGIDTDPGALAIAKERLKNFSDSITLVNDNFRNIDRILKIQNIKNVDAVLLDVGISSYQLDDESRGFSIRSDSRLDMRMNQSSGITAYDVVNKYKEDKLSEIIEKYGEERFHNRIARFIKDARERKAIETTAELAAIVKRAVGYKYRNLRIDPATRTFQAIRIYVNDELGALEEALKSAIFWLKTGGRIVVISFHSLEDRIVKNTFKGYSKLGVLKIITKKPLIPEHEEVIKNPRSRSAKLRVAERIEQQA
ncbi:MAG: 16S rRNA (cytosine(1402)-N(4))-methyltransferase RsmH [Candidatus Omnitrophica bacterium]|nr:16S rRNA (cytosine(1402)-N(4))-methyltransferase RsmH [Candidatus Omnitrophota bacterium]